MDMAREELKKLIPQRLHIPSSRLRLLDSVGHGQTPYTPCFAHPPCMFQSTGEFGEVYKAYLTRLRKQRLVAVKTLRGRFIYFYVRASLFSTNASLFSINVFPFQGCFRPMMCNRSCRKW